jgi:hypothetical protein
MTELSRIQKRRNLNTVLRYGEPGPGGAYHDYVIRLEPAPGYISQYNTDEHIRFQKGPRNEQNSEHGVLDTDLLEIVRDRLISFQAGEFACRENAIALTHIEEALLWMNKRVEDRAERNVLGTYQK